MYKLFIPAAVLILVGTGILFLGPATTADAVTATESTAEAVAEPINQSWDEGGEAYFRGDCTISCPDGSSWRTSPSNIEDCCSDCTNVCGTFYCVAEGDGPSMIC